MFQLEYLDPVRYLWRVFSADSGPRQVAAGIALGMAIGLLPKGNLIVVSLTILLFALRVNIGSGLLTAFLVSLISPHLDPITHGIGIRILNQPAVYHRLATWYDLPLVAWTSLNNTVVMGGCVLGIALLYPVYHLSESVFSRFGPLRRPPLRTVLHQVARLRRSKR
jgi:uncharacterized protein (TIGR03546 family)